MQGFWRVTIKCVIIRVIYTLNKVVHSRTWSDIIVMDRYKCKNGLYVQWAIILQYFTILNYELVCKRNGIPLGAHFIFLNSGSLLGLKMAKKISRNMSPC